MATAAAIQVYTVQQEYLQAGKVQRIIEEKIPGVQIKIRWAREDSQVTVGSGEQRSDQEHSQWEHVVIRQGD